MEYGNSAADHVKLFRTDWHLASANMPFVLVSHCARQIGYHAHALIICTECAKQNGYLIGLQIPELHQVDAKQ